MNTDNWGFKKKNLNMTANLLLMEFGPKLPC